MINNIKKIWEDKGAQISAEMIILLAAIIAIVLVVVMQLRKTVNKADSSVTKTSDKVFDEVDNIK
ncbi:MAG: hypothetical protein V1824_04090 [archaeon]